MLLIHYYSPTPNSFLTDLLQATEGGTGPFSWHKTLHRIFSDHYFSLFWNFFQLRQGEEERFIESVCEVIRCGNMYLVPGQVTEAPGWHSSRHDSSWQGMASCITILWTSPPPGPGSSLSGSRRSDSGYSNSAFQSSPSTDCILASRRDIHDTVTRIEERKIRKLLAFLFDNGHVFQVFKYPCWVIEHVTIGGISTWYDTLESYFRKLEILINYKIIFSSRPQLSSALGRGWGGINQHWAD